jgi:hypothetical protein
MEDRGNMVKKIFIFIFCFAALAASSQPRGRFNGFGRGASAGSFDTDAQAFFTAAGITDATQKSAVNQLVLDFKSAGVWTKMYAVYPFVGGTATTHKFNLKDPRDLDAAFRLVFTGTWTHSSTGADPNGTNAFADTKFIPSSSGFTTSSGSLGYYSRENTAAATVVEFGSYSSSTTNQNSIFCLYTGTVTGASYGTNATAVSVAATRSDGLFMAEHNGATNTEVYRNGSRIVNTAQTGTLSTVAEYIGAQNNTGTSEGFSSRQCAFAFIGQGFTTTEATAIYNAIQTFQTTLSRQV